MPKNLDKINLKREMQKQHYSKKDIMVKGKRASLETNIDNLSIYELMYGDKKMPNSKGKNEIKEREEQYMEVWENYKTYN